MLCRETLIDINPTTFTKLSFIHLDLTSDGVGKKIHVGLVQVTVKRRRSVVVVVDSSIFVYRRIRHHFFLASMFRENREGVSCMISKLGPIFTVRKRLHNTSEQRFRIIWSPVDCVDSNDLTRRFTLSRYDDSYVPQCPTAAFFSLTFP